MTNLSTRHKKAYNLQEIFSRSLCKPGRATALDLDAVWAPESGYRCDNEADVICERAMWASKLLTFQVTSISVLLAAITIALAVEHPEWSPTGLRGVTEWKTTPPHQIDEFVRLLAAPN
jgi:hypothetical protein